MVETQSISSNQGGMPGAFTLAEVRIDNYRTRTFIFQENLDCHPGQFVMAWLPGVGEKPFSIAGSRPLTLTIVTVGPVSDAIHHLKPGDRLWIRGPLGKSYQPHGQRILLAGGGYGAAPLFFLAQEAQTKGIAVDACIGARTAGDILLVKEFQKSNIDVFVTTEDGSMGMQGLITQVIEKLATDPSHRPDGGIYACGPVKMLEAIDALCEKHHFSRQLSWEAHMRCGMGLCGSCEVQLPQTGNLSEKEIEARAAWLVCQDGPVSFTSV
jgi:dihydroorotate dehydrogenase electron transfer subunit